MSIKPDGLCLHLCLCWRVLPLHHERVLLLHGELGVDLDGIIFILQLQQLLPALLRHQLTIINDICTTTWSQTAVKTRIHRKHKNTTTSRGLLVLTVTRRAALSVDSELA